MNGLGHGNYTDKMYERHIAVLAEVHFRRYTTIWPDQREHLAAFAQLLRRFCQVYPFLFFFSIFSSCSFPTIIFHLYTFFLFVRQNVKETPLHLNN
jgi:hypothetical protein